MIVWLIVSFDTLQQLLRKKAAEELKREQERKAEERRKIIAERTGKSKVIDGVNDGTNGKVLITNILRLLLFEFSGSPISSQGISRPD